MYEVQFCRLFLIREYYSKRQPAVHASLHTLQYTKSSRVSNTGTGVADLRSNIQRGPKLVEQALVSRTEISCAKVDDLYGCAMSRAGQQDVLRFQVSVQQALAVHEGKELDQAAHQLSSLLLAVVLLWTQQEKAFVGGGLLGQQTTGDWWTLLY